MLCRLYWKTVTQTESMLVVDGLSSVTVATQESAGENRSWFLLTVAWSIKSFDYQRKQDF